MTDTSCRFEDSENATLSDGSFLILLHVWEMKATLLMVVGKLDIVDLCFISSCCPGLSSQCARFIEESINSHSAK